MFDKQIHATALDINDGFFFEFPLECIGLILFH